MVGGNGASLGGLELHRTRYEQDPERCSISREGGEVWGWRCVKSKVDVKAARLVEQRRFAVTVELGGKIRDGGEGNGVDLGFVFDLK